ncbi:type 2 periplasmic-binding domain-containing protein [Sediminivirga luteola]|jgi:hypothetical protein|uniref:LysR substrate binding domain-containing protein n=1 Tax=Sediminivirga luteola TaxID=1774748 RepID=A0A8J2XKU7_9MICO|nr:hypothetical protein [Sediminivirga luteola]GGA17215.1 hypothetical protein GCM10011333_20380 [Sediminivirga luteola]
MEALRIGFVPGVRPDKWWQRWRTAHPGTSLEPVALEDAGARHWTRPGSEDGQDGPLLDGVLCRPSLLPEDEAWQRVPLYTEAAVAVAAQDHALAALEGSEAGLEDLAEFEDLDEVLDRSDPGSGPLSVPQRFELLAAGTGYDLVPASVARQFGRKDLAIVPLAESACTAELAARLGLQVAFVFRRADDGPLLQDLIGVLKGRRPGSTRNAHDTPPETGTGRADGTARATSRPVGAHGARGGHGRKPRPPRRGPRSSGSRRRR